MGMKIAQASVRKLKGWIKLVVILYCAVGIALYYLQNYLLFYPVAMERNSKYNFSDSCTEINLPFDKETNLNIIQFKPTGGSVCKGVVLYFHGNRKNIGWYAPNAINFTKNNYEIWMIDYPGFGKSTGSLSEEKLYAYALQLYMLARSRFKPKDIIVYGKSIGTGIASQLASVRDCKYLILESPYYSFTSLMSHYFPIYPVYNMLHFHFPTCEYLKEVNAPVIIFQGSDDGVIPYSNAGKLKEILKPDDQFVTIDQGKHNDLPQFLVYRQKLDSLLAR
jgi:uncharacterized protein